MSDANEKSRKERPELFAQPKHFVNGQARKREPTLSEFGKQSEPQKTPPSIIGKRG